MDRKEGPGALSRDNDRTQPGCAGGEEMLAPSGQQRLRRAGASQRPMGHSEASEIEKLSLLGLDTSWATEERWLC